MSICAIGNSRGVTLPVALKLPVGSSVEDEHGRIVIEPVKRVEYAKGVAYLIPHYLCLSTKLASAALDSPVMAMNSTPNPSGRLALCRSVGHTARQISRPPRRPGGRYGDRRLFQETFLQLQKHVGVIYKHDLSGITVQW